MGAGAAVDRRGRARAVRLLAAVVLVVVVGVLLAAAVASPAPAGRPVAVIVRTEPAVLADAERLVTRAGGAGRASPAADLSATVPSSALTRLNRMVGVTSVTVDGAVRVAGKAPKGAASSGTTPTGAPSTT